MQAVEVLEPRRSKSFSAAKTFSSSVRQIITLSCGITCAKILLIWAFLPLESNVRNNKFQYLEREYKTCKNKLGTSGLTTHIIYVHCPVFHQQKHHNLLASLTSTKHSLLVSLCQTKAPHCQIQVLPREISRQKKGFNIYCSQSCSEMAERL